MQTQSAFVLFLCTFSSYAKSHFHHAPSTRAVVIVFRHGDRVPTTTYPGDPFVHLFRPMMGNLTTDGCIRMYMNGRHLARILPQVQYASHRYFYSDSSARCVQSAECWMRGLLDSDTNRYTITTGERIDLILNHPKLRFLCSNYDGEQERSEKHHALFSEYSDVISNLSQITRANYTKEKANWLAYSLIDSIHTEHRLGLPMPSWFTRVFASRSEEYMEKSRFIYSRLPTIQKVSTLLIRELSERLQSAPKDSMSLYAYSTHDAVLGPVLATLNITRHTFPKYGESLVFQLTNDEQLRFFYVTAKGKLQQISPVNCELDDCSLETFALTVSNLPVFNWKNDCTPIIAATISSSGNSNDTLNIVTLIFLFCACAFTLPS